MTLEQNWREKLHKLYPRPAEDSHFWEMGMKGIEDFIYENRQDLLEEILAKIPDVAYVLKTEGATDLTGLKASLRAKFGGDV